MGFSAPLLPLALTLLPLHSQEAPAREGEAAPAGASYLRLVEARDGLSLELAVRTFRVTRQDAPDTLVALVSVMHVAQAAYYDALQTLLDGQDVVLYEQVVEPPTLPPGSELLSAAERSRQLATHRRLQTLVDAMVGHHRRHGQVPSTHEALVAAADERHARRLGRAGVDAWGRPIALAAGRLDSGRLETGPGDEGWTYSALSLGADGEPGGQGADADLRLERRPPGGPAPEPAGLQQDFADALGLVFQLQGIDYSGAQWRNADVTPEELRSLLAEDGAGDSGLLGALDGSSLLGRFAGGLLRWVGSTESGRGMLKLMGIEILSRADELLAAPPPGMAKLFEVLVDRRNAVVLEHLGRLLEEEPGVARVAVFFGAAHMPALERGGVAELGLEPVAESWLTAVDLRFDDMSLPRGQIRFLRRTIRRVLDQQLDR